MEEKKDTSVQEATMSAEELDRQLTEKVGVKIDYSTITSANIIKFLIFSVLGIWIFFIPTFDGITPMVWLIDLIKAALGPTKDWMVLVICIGLAISFAVGKITKKGTFAEFHKGDGVLDGIFVYSALIFCASILFKFAPPQIMDPEVGPMALNLAGNTFFTVSVAGLLVNLLIEFGVLEFIGTLMEPIMRRVYKVPGQSAVDALSSFVAAPAVGVFITNRLYNENVYTEREACCITTNFSVVSLGFFALLVSITETPYMYGPAILCSLITVFIMAAIVIRIPPLSRKKSVYKNGVVQTPEMAKPGKYDKGIFKKALAAATTKASNTSPMVFIKAIPDVVGFALKIVVFVQSIAVVSLFLSWYTPVFEWIGKPFIPYLTLVGMPNAAEIAPACLVGIAEIAMPVLTIAGLEIAPISIFFVIVLSTVQIIFFTESANAMMKADMGLTFGQLVIIFLIRTVIAIPIVSLLAHLFYG